LEDKLLCYQHLESLVPDLDFYDMDKFPFLNQKKNAFGRYGSSFRYNGVVASLPDLELTRRVDASAAAVTAAKLNEGPPAIAVEDINVHASNLEQLRMILHGEIGVVADHKADLELLDAQMKHIQEVEDGLKRVAGKRDGVMTLAALAGVAHAWPEHFDSLIMVFEPAECLVPSIADWFNGEHNQFNERFRALGFYKDTALLFELVDQGAPAIRPEGAENFENLCARSREQSQRKEGIDCGPTVTRWLLPYYSRSETDVAIWGRNAPVGEETAGFFNSIGHAETAVAGKLAEFEAERHGRSASILPALEELQIQLAVEKTSLHLLRTDLDAKISALTELRENIAAGEARIADLERQVTEEQTKVGIATREINSNQTETTDMREKVRAARLALQKTKATLDTLVLECGGTSYDECKDTHAKEAYNKARYEAYDSLGAARATLFNIQDALMSLLDKRRALLDEKFDALTHLSEVSARLASEALQTKAWIRDLQDHSGLLAQREARYRDLKSAHDSDNKLIAATVKLAAAG
jgi:hypothetical protein